MLKLCNCNVLKVLAAVSYHLPMTRTEYTDLTDRNYVHQKHIKDDAQNNL